MYMFFHFNCLINLETVYIHKIFIYIYKVNEKDWLKRNETFYIITIVLNHNQRLFLIHIFIKYLSYMYWF